MAARGRTKAQLCEGEAAGGLQAVDPLQELVMMPLCPQLQHCACTALASSSRLMPVQG